MDGESSRLPVYLPPGIDPAHLPSSCVFIRRYGRASQNGLGATREAARNGPKCRKTRQLDRFSHLSYSPAPSQPSAAWRLRTQPSIPEYRRDERIDPNWHGTSRHRTSGTVQADTVQTTFGTRAKAALIVGGTVILFVVGAVAFQFLRPKVGAAQENAPRNRFGPRQHADQRHPPGPGAGERRADRLRQRRRRMHAALRAGSSRKFHQPHRSSIRRAGSRESPSPRPR